ncbi:MAG: peptidylprolyl isomerase [Cryomorphaceae bacterium]
MKYLILPFLALALVACDNSKPETEQNEPMSSENETPEETAENFIYVNVETSMGDFTLELDSGRAPITVNNFLTYVDSGHYDGTIFHRVISNFMVQGGGFTPDGQQKPTNDPIMLESKTGLKNDVGTVAMARTNAPNSATAQFFINVKDNDFLNYTPGNPGYAVFGKVASGMETVNAIRNVETGTFQQMGDWPLEPVVIKSIKRE